jgi:pimeloyl-ACP methyl ester carboxylesterase
MIKVYLISGLGADKRLYRNIKIDNAEMIYVDWIEPGKKDTLANYAQKLIDEYRIAPGSVVIGTSLGGMITVEIAKKIRLKKAILISSIKTVKEEPFYFNLLKWFPVYKLLPNKLIVKMGELAKPVFGKMDPVEAYMFNSMLENSSPWFLRWAMGAVLKWKNKIIPPNIYHIVGDSDYVFDHKKIKDAIIVKGGTHIMVFDRAKEINQLIAKILNN